METDLKNKAIDINNVQHEGEFTDPVLRCDSCHILVRRTTLHKLGSCDSCGNRRMRNVTIFNEDEKAQMEGWGFADFVAEFVEVDDE